MVDNSSNSILEKRYVAYYRVSTARQGQSGLGLEAQKTEVLRYCQNGVILGSYTDVESGKKDARPELHKALAYCKEANARLVIAKLDRLSRNVAFLANLLEARVPFVACDLPEADEFTLHIFAALAQKEQKMISERTRAALAAKKQAGFRLGSPQNLTPQAQQKSVTSRVAAARSNDRNRKAGALVLEMRQNGRGWTEIARLLNELNFLTRRGKKFHPMQARRLYFRYAATPETVKPA